MSLFVTFFRFPIKKSSLRLSYFKAVEGVEKVTISTLSSLQGSDMW